MNNKCNSCEKNEPDWLKELNQLMKENPNAQVRHLVSTDSISDDYSYAFTSDVSIRLTEYLIIDDEKVVEEKEEVLDHLENTIMEIEEAADDDEWTDDYRDSELEKLYVQFIKKQPWLKAIFVTIG